MRTPNLVKSRTPTFHAHDNIRPPVRHEPAPKPLRGKFRAPSTSGDARARAPHSPASEASPGNGTQDPRDLPHSPTTPEGREPIASQLGWSGT